MCKLSTIGIYHHVYAMLEFRWKSKVMSMKRKWKMRDEEDGEENCITMINKLTQ